MVRSAPFKPDPLVLTLVLAGALTALRVLAIFTTELELYPDEAQYWLWSRELAWGYYSTPPMICWLIAASTAVGGDGEGWVRLPATLAHGLAALAVYAAGSRLYGRWTGFWGSVLYSLMPGVQLSGLVMSTDAPLLMLLAAALALYAALWRGDGRSRVLLAAGLGAVLGLAFLSKYAAIYFLVALLLHAAFSRSARHAWSLPAAGAALAAFALILAPNVVWNATHDFSTLSHTAEETNWNDPHLFNPLELAGFIGEQLGVFGPIPVLLLLCAGTALAARRRLGEEDAALLLFSAPPLLVVSAQAFISGANANWAAAAYVPASVLVAAWLVRWRARRLIGATVVIQGLLGAVFLASVIHGGIADRLGLGNGFKRARGWAATAELVAREVDARPGWTAVATDNRFLFNALAYYGRDAFAGAGSPPLTIWMRKAAPQNQAETTAPLTIGNGGRVLVASIVPDYSPMIAGDFSAWRLLSRAEVRLDPKRTREVALYEASGYRPAPRDRVSGLPRGSGAGRPGRSPAGTPCTEAGSSWRSPGGRPRPARTASPAGCA